MNLPGRLGTQRALIVDYAHYAARFDAIAKYLERWQPPALMVWGWPDVCFDLAEVRSGMHALPRMEAHVLDAGHLLLETHAAVAAPLMVNFARRGYGRALQVAWAGRTRPHCRAGPSSSRRSMLSAIAR